MSEKGFDLQEYMTKGVENIVKGALKATLSDPMESLFMVQYAAASKEAAKRRARLDAAGTIPEILFPIFTNGTIIGEQYLALFKKHRNLIPVISIEGHEEKPCIPDCLKSCEQAEPCWRIMPAAVSFLREKRR